MTSFPSKESAMPHFTVSKAVHAAPVVALSKIYCKMGKVKCPQKMETFQKIEPVMMKPGK